MGRPGEGHPVQIVKIVDDDTFELDETALSIIVDKPHVKDKPLMVLSIAGAFRRGKSFLLSFIVRYLKAKGRRDWLGPEEAPLTGFKWRGGSERETTGIMVWSEVFLIGTNEGEVAVLLMDTQGVFDSKTTQRACATIFSLAALVSSVSIFNLSGNIQEDDLQHLQFFTEYGRLAIKDNGVKPFQKILFLVRDWSNNQEFKYGAGGGQQFLDKTLAQTKHQNKEMKEIRTQITAHFSNVSCFLMPHPGLSVTRGGTSTGKLADMEPDFKTELQSLMHLLLSPSNIVVKEIGGRKIRAQEIKNYFKAYMEAFEGDTMPVPTSLFQATAEVQNMGAVHAALKLYDGEMGKILNRSKPYIDSEELDCQHSKWKETAVKQFTSVRKMGNAKYSEKFLLKLQKKIETSYINLKRRNDDLQKIEEDRRLIAERHEAELQEAERRIAARQNAAQIFDPNDFGAQIANTVLLGIPGLIGSVVRLASGRR